MITPITNTAIDDVLERAVDTGDLPNVVAIAADRDGIIYEGAAGLRAPGAPDAVGPDSRFRIMSMTKMVVTAAALVLAEQLKLDLDAPVEEYCAPFADVPYLERIENATPVVRRPAGKATVKQLITHTSGLGYWFWNDLVLRWQTTTGAPAVISGDRRVLDAPLTHDPGTAFVYGTGTDWLGQVIEAVTGTGLDDAVAKLVTGPLEMAETSFTLGEADRAEVVPVHRRSDGGGWRVSGLDLPADPDYFSGGHGLYSTPRDYLRFQRMLLGEGTAPDGTTILSRRSVRDAFRDQIAPLSFPAQIASADPASSLDMNVGPDHAWGHGLLVNTTDQPGRRRAGSGGWSGLFNTHFWVDPAAGVTGALYSAVLPFRDPGAVRAGQAFETELYASLSL